MYRPKNCKKCGGKMQQGGPAPAPTVAQLEAANREARRIALTKGLVSGENTHVGNSIPGYFDEAGRPITGSLPQSTIPSSMVSNTLPSYVTYDKLQWDQGANMPYFINEQTGDLNYTRPENFYRMRGPQVPTSNIAALNSIASIKMKGGFYMKGGKLVKMQQGGMPRQQDFPDYESWQEAMNQWMQSMAGNQMVQSTDLSSLMGNFNQPLQESDVDAPMPEVAQQAPNRIQEGIQRGIIQAPSNFDGTAQQWYDHMSSSQMNPPQQNRNPFQGLQNVGIGMQAARTGLGWLSSAIERGRQNQYDWRQQTALGQMNPIQASDFQPNPYSLYAKYGGNLKSIMKDYQKWSNDAGPMDMTGGKGNPEMKKGGYEIDRMLITRKLLPELLNFGRLGSNYSKRRKYLHGGNAELAPYHNLTPEQYAMLLQQQSGFHVMPDGTLMPNSEMEGYKKGGINIKPENRGKFTEYCGGKVTDDCIQKGLNSPSAKTRKRANFARNARKWNK